jgi:integrase
MGSPRQIAGIRSFRHKAANMEVPQRGSRLRSPRISRVTIQGANCALREEVKLRARKPKGSIVYNKTRGTWNFLWVEDGNRTSRKLGTLAELPTRADALQKAETVRRDLRLAAERSILTVLQLVERFRAEKMPERFSTRYGYEAWIKNHILPRWGSRPLTELQPRVVELWLRSLPLSPKSRVHIRGVIYQLWEFAMWAEIVPAQRNPMELVSIKGATKRNKRPHSLTVDEFRRFLEQLHEPIRTIALVCVSFGLRISEALALKWSDLDWLHSTLLIERGIVRQRVGNVKTAESEQKVSVDTEMLTVINSWRQITTFASESDWIFASPAQIGRLPVSYPWVWRSFRQAALKAGVPRFGTHSLRHSYRSWLDAAGTPIAVQQKLMRHSDIRTTFNVYGDVVTDEMARANSKVARMALTRSN